MLCISFTQIYRTIRPDLKSITLHPGSQTQAQRLKAMEKLKEFKCRVLISTDLVSLNIFLCNYVCISLNAVVNIIGTNNIQLKL